MYIYICIYIYIIYIYIIIMTMFYDCLNLAFIFSKIGMTMVSTCLFICIATFRTL